ncbi:hypothetical protein EAE99_008648 [Botrytis elliptica]|nr:hypothetical protein EAE99_008648 [Botrytis elliptica]
MPGFFGKNKDKAAKGPATASVQSNSDRPKQERRRHSDYVQDKSSHRPGLFTSKTWHTPTTGEPSPKLPKSKKHGRVRSLFSHSDSSNDEDEDGLEFKCKGDGSLVRDGGSSSRDNASLKPVQRKGSTRSRSTVKPKIPSSRSSSKNSLAPRKTTSSDAPPTMLKSPYTELSATSHINPRPRRDVCDPRDRTEDSGAISDPEYCRGRDVRNSSRNRVRDAKVQPPNNGYDSSRNGRKPSSRRRENPDSSAPKTAGNRYVARVPLNDHEPHTYQVQDYRKFNLVSLNQHRVYELGTRV